MKIIIYLLGLNVVIGSSNSICAQDISLEQVKLEVEEVTLKEQGAFKDGDCETVLNLMHDDITFYANGRSAPSKNVIKKFCEDIPRPFKGLSTGNLTVYPLTSNSAYVVRTLEFEKNEKILVREIVTKIWNRFNGEWKMVHLHSTVKEIPKTQ
jgi:ketosteroid isomerase-like protein